MQRNVFRKIKLYTYVLDDIRKDLKKFRHLNTVDLSYSKLHNTMTDSTILIVIVANIVFILAIRTTSMPPIIIE